MRIESESNWGEPTDESESRKRQNRTFEYLRKEAREHYPILKKIKEREYEVERLVENFIAREVDVSEDEHPWIRPSTLESLYEKICEEQGDQTERAKILRAAIAWSEKRKGIDELKKKTGKFGKFLPYSTYPAFHKIDPHDYTEKYEARSSLEWAIRDVMTKYNDDWEKDYEFREEFENFLNILASERCCIRETFESFFLYKNINRYLKNPSWHSPGITDFLLIDLIDTYLIGLERKFMLGLFPARVADKIRGPSSPFDSLTVRLLEKLLKKIARYSRLSKAARKIVVIRSEVASGTYHAKTLIERLRKLEEQGIVIDSLIYGLLELRAKQQIQS